MEGIRRLFEPRSVALVGVSKDPSKMSHWLIRNVARANFQGPVYPISPSGGEILGYKTYPSLSALPGQVDLVLVSVASKAVKDVIVEASCNGAASAVILSSGFGEIRDEAGKELQEEILGIARKGGMRIMGPNCLGIYNAHRNLNGTYFAVDPIHKGRISIVSQSGAYGGVLVNEMNRRGIGLGKLASIGNQMDVCHQDVIEYLCEDPDTDVIGVFVEGIKDGAGFLSVVKRVSKVKPIVIFKGGRTNVGLRAAASHTGSLAGDFAVAKAAFAQAGALVAHTTEDFFDYLFALAHNHHRLPKDEKLALITISGGPCVTASDYCEELGLVVPELRETTRSHIRKYVPFFAADSNPVDMTVGTLPENLGPCVDAVLSDPEISGAISINWGWDVPEFAKAFVDASVKHGKPVLAFASENPSVQEIFRTGGVVNFPAPERAVRGYRGLVDYKRIRERDGASRAFNCHSSEIVEKHKGKAVLDEHLSKEVLRQYGVPTCKEAVAESLEELAEKAGEIGYPVVLKAFSADLLHKTEKGAVVLNIPGRSRLLTAARGLRRRLGRSVGFLVQEWVPAGVEVIVGMKRDRIFGFGPVMAFGLGGVFTEVLKDVALRVCPLSWSDALGMIREIRGYPILKGYRGSPPADEEALAEVIVRASELAMLNPRILEMDINPLILNGRDIKAVDALIVLDGAVP
ncbi:MAG: acetate--CoA ligase family protein [Thermodesulfobacteriota bacterium]